MRRLIIRVFFVLALISSGFLTDGYETRAQSTSGSTNQKNSEGSEIINGPLIEELNKLKKQAKIKKKIVVRKFTNLEEFDYGYYGAGICKDSEDPARYIIGVGGYFSRGEAKIITVRAMLAHELGHLRRGHLNSKLTRLEITDEMMQVMQTQADIFAIKLIGRSTYLKGLKPILTSEVEVNEEWKTRLYNLKKFLNKNKRVRSQKRHKN